MRLATLAMAVAIAMSAAGSLLAAEPAAPPAIPGATTTPTAGVGVWRGRLVRFEIVAGWAIVEGDIVLGRVDELEVQLGVPRERGLRAKGFGADIEANLWPRAASGLFEVPYTIEVDPNGTVPGAVAAFNLAFAGFMQFVPRIAQVDYVAFTLSQPDGTPACSSALGRNGGKQTILGPRTCSTGTLLHEMGHAIGLWHEHQRPDRDQWVTWLEEYTAKNYRGNWGAFPTNKQVVTPYDVASLMHYADFSFPSNYLPTMVTIPQGLGIGQRSTFSAADVDTVRRIYGAAPAAVTVTSDPPGLRLEVDGQAVVTPQTFNWPLGSAHVIDVPQIGQVDAGASYVFGRWNVDLVGDGATRRQVTVTPGSGGAADPAPAPAVTVYSAQFVRVFPFTLDRMGDSAAAAAATAVSVAPPPQPYSGLAGSFYRSSQLLMLNATVGEGFAFGGWFGHNFTSVKDGFGAPSLLVYASDSGTAPPSASAQGLGASASMFRVRGRGSDGVGDGFSINVDGASVGRTPFTSAYLQFKPGEVHQVEARTPQSRNSATVRYVFTHWDGLAGNPVAVTVPAAGEPTRDVTANFTAQYAVKVAPDFSCAGTVTLSPPSADGYYDYGQSIGVQVTPAAGWFLSEWTGDFTGTGTQRTVVVNGQVFATPNFNTIPVPFALTRLGRAFAVVGEPEFDLMVYGSGFTPSIYVGVNGVFRPPVYLDANRLRVPLFPADYAQPGEITIVVANTTAKCNNYASLSVPVRAAGYAWPATTPVVEFYHQGLDHYFITANPDEMSKLDNGVFKGWARTGKSFKVFAADSVALSAEISRTVCRYYGNPAAGLDSHFYSAAHDECAAVRKKFPEAWVFESSDVFQSILPDRTTGSCPDGTIPVYRLWNQRPDVNHRYTTDLAVRDQMVAQGYVPEGYGTSGVALCAPG